MLYSQLQKYNVSLQTGYKLNENNSLDANIIYYKATDVGYPALTMDVSLAETLITSLTHHYSSDSTLINSLESKLYFNTITHVMDDSKRPDGRFGWTCQNGVIPTDFIAKLQWMCVSINFLWILRGFTIARWQVSQ